MADVVTARDVIARRRDVPVSWAGRRATTPSAWLRRLADRGWARATVRILAQRMFAGGLVDAAGGPVDPATTGIEALLEEDGTLVVRVAADGRAPVHVHCTPKGPLGVRGRDGVEAQVDEWRDLPDVLPAFLVPDHLTQG